MKKMDLATIQEAIDRAVELGRAVTVKGEAPINVAWRQGINGRGCHIAYINGRWIIYPTKPMGS